jgi:ubiquinone/menaquinone biosynthesis C-methylase UbiE
MDLSKEQQQQVNYYSKTADTYDRAHYDNSPHFSSLRLIGLLCNGIKIESVLDTGCGTGRGLSFLKQIFPNITAKGNDMSADLLQVAINKYGIPAEDLICASSYEIPFRNDSFDVTIALGVMHHVEHPEKVISEMYRVSKKAIFISDSNRFAQGNFLFRLLKLFLYKVGLWWKIKAIMNGGKRSSYSEGDGFYYSYSLYDNLSFIKSKSDRVLVLPLSEDKRALQFPLLFSDHLLFVGLINRT